MIRNLKLAFLLVMAMATGTMRASRVTLTVHNSSAEQRQEVVAFDARRVWKALGVAEGSQLVVTDQYRLPVPSQLTHDGQLLVDASVLPGSTARLNVKAGRPDPTQSYAEGKLYAWRVDDFTWENDRCSYRAYGPALQRTGEQAFGIDVWLKSTPFPDVEKRYAKVYNANRLSVQWRKEGRKQEADSLLMAVSLHHDHGTGLDCYNVGPSLGCGTPAVMLGDSIVLPYCFKEYRVLDNGPLRFAAEFVYNTTNIDGQSLTEHRLVTLDRRSYFNHMSVWFEGQRKPIDVCAGVVVHTDRAADLTLAADHVAYTDPGDSPQRHQFEIYVAALFPDAAVDATRLVRDPWHKKAGIVGNAVGIKRGLKPGDRFDYYFGASWCQGNTPNRRFWDMQIAQKFSDLRQPLATDVVVE